MIDPVKFFAAIFCLGVVIWGAFFDEGPHAGRAWALLLTIVVISIWFFVIFFRKRRKKGHETRRSLSYAFKKVILEWFK
jgi:hypothetical protein